MLDYIAILIHYIWYVCCERLFVAAKLMPIAIFSQHVHV